jgi:penicillin-binding protein A
VIACRGVPAGVRDYDFAHAFAWSINANFAEVGLKIGPERLVQAARRFGFEEPIPFDLPVTRSRILQPGQSMSEVLLATTAFGQGQLSVTPLQMALVAAAVANDGVIMEPYLVAEVRTPEGAVEERRQPKRWRQAIPREVAATLRAFMVTAVRDGFSGAAAIPGVQVGGKTGTAETAPGEEPHAWFTGIAPAENPAVVVAVIVENGGQGAAVAAPVAGAVMQAALARP